MLTGEVPFQAETQVGVGDEARQRADARRQRAAARRLGRGRGGGRPGHRQGPRATATARWPRWSATWRPPSRSRRRGEAAPAARRPACSTRSPAPSAGSPARAACPVAGIAMGLVGGRPDRRGADLRRQGGSTSSARTAMAARSEIRLPATRRPSSTPTATAEETGTPEPGDRRQPHRNRLGDRALRHRGLRRHQGRRRDLTSTPATQVDRQGDRDPQPELRLGRRDLRRSRAPPPDDLGGWGRPVGQVSDGGTTRDRSTCRATAARLPDLVHEAGPRRRRGSHDGVSDVACCQMAARYLPRSVARLPDAGALELVERGPLRSARAPAGRGGRRARGRGSRSPRAACRRRWSR